MARGLIIIGYQGIGKSTLSNKYDGHIDLESSTFWFADKETKQLARWDNWEEIYTNIVVDIAEQGNIVFTSSHQGVREEFAKKGEIENVRIIICVPSLDLKDEWISKLKVRYEDTQLIKDYKAWKNAEDRYVDNITELLDDAKKYNWETIIIDKMDYDLWEMIQDIM